MKTFKVTPIQYHKVILFNCGLRCVCSYILSKKGSTSSKAIWPTYSNSDFSTGNAWNISKGTNCWKSFFFCVFLVSWINRRIESSGKERGGWNRSLFCWFDAFTFNLVSRCLVDEPKASFVNKIFGYEINLPWEIFLLERVSFPVQ